MVEVTEEWLHQHCSNPSKTAWTSAQFKVLGIAWPPVNGWKREVVGKLISQQEADAFAAAASSYTKRTLKIRRKQLERALKRM